jgi:hypothetical protein
LPSSRLLGTLSLFIVALLIIPTLASPVSACLNRGDPLKRSLASLASEPLGTAPVTLRREAYETLLPYAGMLPPGMAERIVADSDLFADLARLTSAEPLDHDRELVKELLRLYSGPGTGPATKDAAAQAATLLLRAGRHAALLALSDGELVADGSTGNAKRSLVSPASAALKTAKLRYEDAMKVIRELPVFVYSDLTLILHGSLSSSTSLIFRCMHSPILIPEEESIR